VVEKTNPRRKNRGFFYLALAFMHLPMALHLALLGQPAHGLKGAAFLPAVFLAGAIIIFPYIVISN
jgi:hypothetical protein